MLICSKCGRKFEEKFILRCTCGGTLLVKRKYDSFAPRKFLDIRRYIDYLPVDEKFLPSLTPGITPISKISDEVYLKLDYLQPTGSFKDRGTYVTVAKIKEEGIDEVVIDSSGNAGLSLATYGMAEGIKVHVFLSYNAKPEKIARLNSVNARLHFVEGDRMRVHEEAVKFSERTGIPYASHWLNPYFLEGTKTIAFEIYEQIGIPRYIFVPVGSGTAFLGIWKGFKELLEMGEINKMPSLVAVQAEGYESLCKRSKSVNKLADGIAIPNPPRIEEMKVALRETSGFCISVGEEETLAGYHWLRRNGFFIEETSATALAGYWKAREKGLVKGSSLLLLTGSAKSF
ncbi:pyridoxal-phosphate dependent enzyme [Pyrococcus horikoshii]|uniref:Pyridoxal-phosphate dependent enzyme n=2 Tax=Pyrococcus horikoshii TaxID=53953 RepID=A0A832WJR4_PYRHR|nr:pyridoxal-phosphate dependent enzyme [Pyrococcus horikoshii]HII60604.1 pyridoxal-phosphate dependent enzyme [Pyrococcus horikoshii]